MYKIELGGGCFKHDMEQTIILWFSSKSEFSSLNDFIQFCWIKQHTGANYGRQSLEEWFAEFHIEDICPETFDKKIQEYTSDLYHAEIQIPTTYIRAVRLKGESWDEVIYAAESEYDYLCFWWYTTA